MAVNIEERVDGLETLFGQFVSQTGAALLRLERNTELLQIEMREFKKEMSDFKDEMKVFKDEMSDFKDEMKVFKDEMSDFKDEMKVFKDEMSDFKDEMRTFKDEAQAENRKMNQKWGELAHRLGKITEDLVSPSLERIILEEFNVEIDELMVDIKRRHPQTGERREFDAIATGGEMVFLNSTKSTLKKQHVDEFTAEISIFREYFPQYQKYKLMGIIAALRIDKGVLKYAEKKGFLVLGVGDEVMEVKNSKGFKPRLW